jgi:hypothetical protein
MRPGTRSERANLAAIHDGRKPLQTYCCTRLHIRPRPKLVRQERKLQRRPQSKQSGSSWRLRCIERTLNIGREYRSFALLGSKLLPVRMPAACKTAPARFPAQAGAATFSRFVSTIPRERWNRLSARLEVPKDGPYAGLAGSTDLPRSVYYWADAATVSRFYRYARWVPTTLSGC